MTYHLLLPQRMVNPLLAQLAIPNTKNLNIHLWVYEGKTAAVKKEIDIYRAFRKDVKETDSCFNLPLIEEVRDIKIEEKIENVTLGFNNLLYQALEIYNINFRNNIEEGDKIALIGEGQLLIGVAYYLLKNKGNLISLELILPLEEDETTTLENILLLEGKGNLRIDLIRHDRGYNLMATGIAMVSIYENLTTGVYVHEGGPKDVLYLTDQEMDVKTPVNSIANLKQLEANLKVALDSDKFQKNNKVGGAFREYLKNINAYLKNIENYLFSIRNIYRSDFKRSDMSGKINKLSITEKGRSSKYYCQNAFSKIMKMSFTKGMDFSLKGEKTEIKKLLEEGMASSLVNFSDILNPFLSARETKDAFSNEGEKGFKLRSACLDVWERVYENVFRKKSNKLEAKDYIKVEELTKQDNKESWNLYSDLPDSNASMNVAAIFNVEIIEMDVNEIITQIQAFTTPTTGFAVSIKKGHSCRELKERSKEFKQFLYDYIKETGGFCQEFINYVSDNCSTEDLSEEKKSFFEKYPQFGQHIPIY